MKRPGIAFACALALCTGPALAQTAGAPATEPSASGGNDEAREAFSTGLAALQDGRFADARAALERSYQLRRVPSVCLNLGLALRGLGRLVEARARFREFESLASPALHAQFDADVTTYLAQIERDLAHVHLAALEPAGSAVTVDGAPAVFEPGGDIAVDPGRHRVDASAPGYATASQPVDATSGARVEVRLLLERAQRAPVEGPRGPVEHGGSGATLRTVGWVGLGVGIALVAGGAAALAWQWTEADAWNGPTCGLPGALPLTMRCIGARDTASLAGALATTGFIAGGVLGVAGIVMVLAAPSANGAHGREHASLRCRPVSAPGELAGVACDGWSL